MAPQATTSDEWVDNEKVKRILKEHLDETDYRIYKALNEDGRMSDTEIGERVGLSRTAARRRRKKLQDEGPVDIIGVPSCRRPSSRTPTSSSPSTRASSSRNWTRSSRRSRTRNSSTRSRSTWEVRPAPAGVARVALGRQDVPRVETPGPRGGRQLRDDSGDEDPQGLAQDVLERHRLTALPTTEGSRRPTARRRRCRRASWVRRSR